MDLWLNKIIPQIIHIKEHLQQDFFLKTIVTKTNK